MNVAQFERVFRALQGAGVRFIVVGGVAAIAHGVVRYTNDLDLVLAFDEENLRNGVAALEGCGFKAKIPVSAEEFAKAENRKRWAAEKGMIVFQLALFVEDDLPIDIFIEPPFAFDEEYARAVRYELAPDCFVPVVAVDRLIQMKKLAGRARDLDDISRLQKLGRSLP